MRHTCWVPEDDYSYEYDEPPPSNYVQYEPPYAFPIPPPPEEESDVPVAITEDSSVITSDLKNLKSSVAIRTGFKLVLAI